MSLRETLFSPKNLKLLADPLGRTNPVTVLVLGICSALAVTVKLEPAVVMAISVTAVVAVSNVIMSLLRSTIP
ncbi:MAG: NADH:ubiquinone reductase (Na(+)-transporting) subunit D, partial [Prevotellaceae bacterium]|nr:NADH:ubiquinone reductase (Na(+)-transporting) subunit D [Prevotellaceae bacterium]